MKLALWPSVVLMAVVGSYAQAAAPARPAGVAPGPHPESPEAPVTDARARIPERFPDLDAYLRHLESRSHLDGAWYREIRPGVFELQTGNLRLTERGAPKRIFTREELERKFGFRR